MDVGPRLGPHESIMTGQVRWSIAISAVVALVLLVFTLWYTGKAARDSEQKWCGIVTTMDDAYASRPKDAPPLTGVGQRIADQMHQLRNDFNC